MKSIFEPFSVSRCRHFVRSLVLAGLCVSLVSAEAAIQTVGTAGEMHATIQAAVTAANPGDIILVSPGTYTENVTINKTLVLESTGGRAVTTIAGISGVGAVGTVRVTSGANGVVLGGAGKGFTVLGVDNGSPGIENAALYFQGGQTGVQILGNEIVAAGDHALVAEFSSTISGWIIDGNIFSGQTFVGPTPAGNGFATQFTEANVPRQLVVLGNGGGDLLSAKATNITFTNNLITGVAGGINASAQEQGNQLVTLDVASSTIAGNTFAGTTTRYGGSLRVRRPDTVISGNSFTSTGLGLNTSQLFVQNNTDTLGDIVALNSFDKGVFLAAGTTVGLNVQGAVDSAPAGSVLHVLRGTYAESVNTTAKAVELVIGGAATGLVTFDSLQLDADDTLAFQINGTAAGLTYDQLAVGSVVLGNAALVVGGTRVAAANNSFSLIRNTGEAAIGGMFAGYDEDSGLELNGRVLRVSYVGGTGNDFVLYMELPQVLADPESQLVFAGDPVVFAVTATSTDPLSYQWLKDRVEIDGATSDTFEIAAVAPEDAGKYSCRVSNSVGAKVSQAAVLGVVTPVTGTAEFNELATLRLSVDVPALPSGARTAFQWKKDGEALLTGPVTATGQSVKGAATRSLAITKSLPAEAGVYTCEATLAEGEPRLAATYTVQIHPRPVITPAGPFNWGVGVPVTQVLEASNGPVTFRASRLPVGVKLDTSTGQLSGQPTRAASGLSLFKVMATNTAGVSDAVEFAYEVAALGDDVGGVFHGLVERSSDLGMNGLGGSVKLAVTQSGAFSGSLVVDLRTYAFKGVLTAATPGGDAVGSVVIPRSAPAEALTLEFTQAAATGQLTGTLSAEAETVAVLAWRTPWKLGNPATAYAGLYTALLELPLELQGDAAYPQGNGYVSLTVTAATGLIKCVGRLADGTSLTISTAVAANGQVPLFRTLYSSTDVSVAGSLHGWAQVSADAEPFANSGHPLLDGGLTWLKGANAASTAPKAYRAGIALHEQTLVGGRYQPPAGGEIVLALESGADNARLVFAEGGLESSGAGGSEASFQQLLTLAAPAAVTLPTDPALNPNKVTIGLLASATGLFNGSFTLSDPDPTDVIEPIASVKRKASFYGVLVPRLGAGAGYFLLNELPPYPGYTPQHSGQVLLEGNP
jgi:hypothetical protein